jgi:hypothetical protein
MNIELSNYVKERGTMFEWASKVVNKKELTPEQISISESVNKFALEIANSGMGHVALSDYLQRVVQEQIYDEPSELLDVMFNQGSIGEFDDYSSIGSYKNYLLAHEVSERGGNVDKSYVDFSRYSMVHTNLQIETELRYDELRRDGAMTIAQLTLYAIEALQNKKFQSIFTNLNSLLVSGANVFDATAGLTVQLMDDFAGYVTDHSSTGQQLITGLSTDLRDIKNMPGYTDFLSNDMKSALNMGTGILNVYNSVPLASISAGKVLADGSTLIPAKTIYGFADKIGQCDMRGQLRVLQTPNNSKEVIELKFTGYEFIYAIDKLEKVAKIKVK